ncbi:MAG: tRNA uracil 4-sulfurtransferase ThiI [Candidatus Micrarchaeota archaeon]
MLISAACSEITIKGGNRRAFESLLIRNIRSALGGASSLKVSRHAGRLLISADGIAKEDALDALRKTFGIDHVYFPDSCRPEIGEIEKAVIPFSGGLAGKYIRVETKRSDKGFPVPSQEVNRIIGSTLVGRGARVDLESPEKTIYIDILPGRALVYMEKFRCEGGLPVGSSGKLLSLLSGGIDSPVATWMMMRRGCTADLFHLHSQQSNGDVFGSKIIRIAEALGKYSPKKLRLTTAPYHEFYKKSLGMDPRIELVLFRRFLFHLSNELAARDGYKGVVTGDSVGQVASQTTENIFASDEACSIPVFRPLAGFNKQEIIDTAVRIGTYGISIEQYKDCCSLVAQKKPSTRARLDAVRAAEALLDIPSLVRRTLEQSETLEP